MNVGNIFKDSVKIRPDRVALYSYAHVPWVRGHQKRMDTDLLPTRDEKFALFAAAIRAFGDSGYRQIGMDHFALPDDELSLAQAKGTLHRNFQGYTTHGNCDLIGFGVSSISQLGDLFIQSPVELDAWQTELARGRLPTARECR